MFSFDLQDANLTANKVILEGESYGDLSLIAHLTFEDVNQYLPHSKLRKEDSKYDYVLNIVWQHIFSSHQCFSLIKYPYKEFICEYQDLMKKIKDEYIKNFACVCDDDDYKMAIDNY